MKETQTPKQKARNQLIFWICVLLVAGGGYLATRSARYDAPSAPVTPDATSTPETVSTTVTLEGRYVCLPHAETDGPQTLECALGIRTDDGKHYALDLQGVGGTGDVQTEGRIRVTGSFVPLAALSSDRWYRYAIEGIVSATGFEKL